MVDLNKGIRREVTRLSERWSALLVHAGQWQAKLDDMLPVSSFKILKLHIGCINTNNIKQLNFVLYTSFSILFAEGAHVPEELRGSSSKAWGS